MEKAFLPGTTKVQGLTFIELIVALVILLIIAVVSVPVFVDIYQQYHLSTTTQNLYYVLQYAKSEAIKNNSTVFVSFQSGDNWCYGVKLNSACSCSVANDCSLGSYSTSKLEDLTLSTTGLTGNSITFDGAHGATLTTATITFTIYGQSKSVSVKVNPLGSMKLCSSSISGYSAC